ncbi:MAG: tetratricopeptide repeat protein [Acidobacteriia bacterium]|nr:tetratricopeptide repeat protein [Terriglobia bacterium]
MRACTLLALCVMAAASLRGQQAADWQEQVKGLVAQQHLDEALRITEKRLETAPQDVEARGWRARLLTWANRLPEAEADYRLALAGAPKDTDLMSGLAVVLTREQRFDDALKVLTEAKALDPRRSDIRVQRGRALRALGRYPEARKEFAEAARLDPKDEEARAGLKSIPVEPRHLLRAGNDTDFFNYTDTAQTQTVSLDSRWTQRWSTSFAGGAWQRFGVNAGKFTAGATFHFNPRTSLTAGAAAANDQAVIPHSEVFFELDRGIHLSDHAALRGIDAAYRQHWFWYQGAHVLTIMPSLLFYLPCDWTFQLSGIAARSGFAGIAPEWRPSGVGKLGIPLAEKVTGNLFFAVGAENFAQVDQLGSFSARTYGGGLKVQFTPRQDVSGVVSYQSRTQSRTQTSFGLSYGLRF